MKGVAYARGVTLATLLAGPIVSLPVMVSELLLRPSGFWDTVAGVAMISLVSVQIGGAIALVPNLVGATLLAWLGRRHEVARHPLFWAATGAATGAPIGLAAFSDHAPESVGPFAMIASFAH